MGVAVGQGVEFAIVQGGALERNRGPIAKAVDRRFKVVAGEVGRGLGD